MNVLSHSNTSRTASDDLRSTMQEIEKGARSSFASAHFLAIQSTAMPSAANAASVDALVQGIQSEDVLVVLKQLQELDARDALQAGQLDGEGAPHVRSQRSSTLSFKFTRQTQNRNYLLSSPLYLFPRPHARSSSSFSFCAEPHPMRNARATSSSLLATWGTSTL